MDQIPGLLFIDIFGLYISFFFFLNLRSFLYVLQLDTAKELSQFCI